MESFDIQSNMVLLTAVLTVGLRCLGPAVLINPPMLYIGGYKHSLALMTLFYYLSLMILCKVHISDNSRRVMLLCTSHYLTIIELLTDISSIRIGRQNDGMGRVISPLDEPIDRIVVAHWPSYGRRMCPMFARRAIIPDCRSGVK